METQAMGKSRNPECKALDWLEGRVWLAWGLGLATKHSPSMAELGPGLSGSKAMSCGCSRPLTEEGLRRTSLGVGDFPHGLGWDASS